MKLINLFITASLLFLLPSCKKENAPEPAGANAAKTSLNVSYGSDALQNMDIYLPEGRTVTTTKVIVLIHGGAWSAGDKTDFDRFITTFKTKFPQYAFFNINYRLSAAPNNLFPTQELDVKAALDFIYSKSNEYLISDKYVLMGASAGGHLAMLQGYKYNTPVKPKAIVSLSGPTDLADMYDHPVAGNALLSTLLASVIGKTPVQDPTIYTDSSPVNFINANAPPTILFYGDTDPLVDHRQAIFVENKLKANGKIVQNILYNGSGHVDTWSEAVFTDCFVRIEAFLTTHVQ